MKTKCTLVMALVATLFFANAQINFQSFVTTSESNALNVELVAPVDEPAPQTLFWGVMLPGCPVPVSVGEMPMRGRNASFTSDDLMSNTTYDIWTSFNAVTGPWEWRKATTQDAGIAPVKASPEPASMILSGTVMTVKIPDEFLGKTVTVYNLVGQSQTTVLLIETNQNVNLGFLPKGIYVVLVGTGGPVIGRMNLF